VAQPGRAPGSGPGGRRFKSSLPDQFFQTLKQRFWFSVYIDGVEIVDGRVFLDFQLSFHRELQSDLPATTSLSLPNRTPMQGHAYALRSFFAADGPSSPVARDLVAPDGLCGRGVPDSERQKIELSTSVLTSQVPDAYFDLSRPRFLASSGLPPTQNSVSREFLS
jgi:hypothetical protein